MKCTKIALQVFASKQLGLIKTNAVFNKKYSTSLKEFEKLVEENPRINDRAEQLESQFESMGCCDGIICAYDDNFPVINTKANGSQKPFLLFYRGDISLLKDLNNIVAVIGLTEPTPEIEERERSFVKLLVDNGIIILSGLADGCDSISHKVCVEEDAPTIAVLPSTLNKIFPPKNTQLAEDIVSKGGLLITEYYQEPQSRERISWFIQRDGVQALFSKAVILTASYRHGEGDSGSRHAMEAGQKFGHNCYMMYNEKKDKGNQLFGLNQDFSMQNDYVKTLSKKTIQEIFEIENPLLKRVARKIEPKEQCNEPQEEHEQLGLTPPIDE